MLDPVTPHVGLWHDSGRDPMGDYVESLRRVRRASRRRAPCRRTARRSADLARRVDELLAHEAARETDVLNALADGPKTAAGVAGALRWRRRGDRFDQLPGEYRQFAVAETLAHLQHLREQRRAKRTDTATEIIWSLSAGAPTP